jgi:hypothetical protein
MARASLALREAVLLLATQPTTSKQRLFYTGLAEIPGVARD